MSFSLLKYKKTILALSAGLTGLITYRAINQKVGILENIPREYPHQIYSKKKPIESKNIPTRLDNLHRLKSGEEFDLIVIGGGCTGSGVALEAVSRGLKVALVEKNDFASGTSSRSTKLIHGGVRYLEKAFKTLDFKQFRLVNDALKERKHLLSISPNLSKDIPIIVPIYYQFPMNLFFIPYFWIGMKMYDLFAGFGGPLKSSFYMRKKHVIEKFPMLNKEGLKGAIVYYDGIHNDARMNLQIALTASYKGAAVTNHVEVIEFLKEKNGIISGIKLRDNITNDEFEVKCKSVVNATGCFSDNVRRMENPNVENIISPSSGVHVVLPSTYSPPDAGMLIPNTDDGRVLFLLPWEGSTIAGTTDSSCEIKDRPKPTVKEVEFIMKELKKYLKSDLTTEDVKATWSGIRPLAIDKNSTKKNETAKISRDHVINTSKNGIVTISGGKWTTYRLMSEEVIDSLLKLKPELAKKGKKGKKGDTKKIPLVGSSGWSLSVKTELMEKGYSEDISDHLSRNYGYYAYNVADLGLKKGLKNRLITGYPFIEAEILFGIKNEYAMSVEDIIARRTRIAFLNREAASKIVPRVIELMAKEKKWDSKKRAIQFDDTMTFLDTMNVLPKKRYQWNDKKEPKEIINKITQTFGTCPLNKEEIKSLQIHFNNNNITTNKIVSSIQNISLKNSKLHKCLPLLSKSLKNRSREHLSSEDFFLSLSSAIIKNEN